LPGVRFHAGVGCGLTRGAREPSRRFCFSEGRATFAGSGTSYWVKGKRKPDEIENVRKEAAPKDREGVTFAFFAGVPGDRSRGGLDGLAMVAGQAAEPGICAARIY